MTALFPRDLLREKVHSWNLAGVAATPGDTGNSVSVLTRSDGGGFWKCSMGDVSLSGYRSATGKQRQRLSTLLWRAVRQICNGGVVPIIVWRNDTLFRPWPANVAQTTGQSVPHFEDAVLFDDGTGYYQSVIDIAAGAGALRGTQLNITVNYAGQLVGGESFSILHPTMDWRVYEIATVEMPAGAIDGYTKLLLHFDGDDSSTLFVDSSPNPKVFTASGDAQIDTAQSKFGGASGLFDGTGDYIASLDHSDFTLGSSDFTIDTWFQTSAGSAIQLFLCGQMDSAGTPTSLSFYIERRSTNDRIRFLCFQGAATNFAVESLAAYTNAVNPGWHHLAVVRNGSNLLMFIDGVLQQTTAISGAINNSANSFAIGRGGEVASNTWNGWIDEFRLSVGIARWTSAFAPSAVAWSAATITFNPPLREAVASGTALEFDQPRCKMRLANPGSMDLQVQPWTFNSASVEFVESP
jgi:hypothetical protein